MLAVALALGMMACGDLGDPDDTPKTLTGSVTISGGTVAPAELTANYSGTEAVTYQWYKGTSEISGATEKVYTAAEEGTYWVSASLTGYVSVVSENHVVTKPALPYKDFLGTWKGLINSGGTYYETIVLTADKFRLDYTRPTSAGANQHFEFVISEWEKQDAIPKWATDLVSTLSDAAYFVLSVKDKKLTSNDYLTNEGVTAVQDNGLHLFLSKTGLSMYRKQPGVNDFTVTGPAMGEVPIEYKKDTTKDPDDEDDEDDE